MTVQSQTSRADYNGNGATTVFAVPFYFLLDTDLQVIRTDSSTTPATVVTLVLNSDYTVSGAGNPVGGSITAAIAPTNTQRLSILRNVPYTQLKHYVPNDPFPAASHEMGLDKLTMEVQQLAEVQSRALTLAPNTTSASTELPTPEANALIGWNSAADALQNVDPVTLATIVAFGTANADQFTGNGAQKDFTLSANPGVLANLDVAVGGVTQSPTTDYTWNGGTTLSFVVAPPNGVKVLARYMQGLPQAYNPDLGNNTDPAKGSALIGFLPAPSGAVGRTVQSKLRDRVSVFDFMTEAQIADVRAGTLLVDVTSPLQTAINSIGNGALYFPDGFYKITLLLTVPTNATPFLFGNGYGKCGIFQYSNTLGAIKFNSVNPGGGIQGMTLASSTGGAVPGSSGIGLYMLVCGNNFIVRDMLITNFDTGMRVEGSNGERVENITIRYFRNFGVDLPAVSNQLEGRYSNIQISNVGFSSPNSSIGLSIKSSGGHFFKDFDILACNQSVVIAPSGGMSVTYCSFYDVLGDTPINDNWIVDGTNGTVVGCEMDGCWGAFSTNGSGLVTKGANLISLQWIGGRLRENGKYGWDHQGGTNVSVVGTHIAQNSKLTTLTYYGVHVAAGVSAWQLLNCIVGNFGSGLGTQQLHCVVVDAGASQNFQVQGNFFTNPGAGGFSVVNGSTTQNWVVQGNLPIQTAAVNQNRATSFAGVSIGTVGAGLTRFLGLSGQQASELDAFMPIGRAGVCTQVIIAVDTAPGVGQSFTYTVRLNGVNTSMTGSISGASTFLLVLQSAFAVSPVDSISIMCVTTGSAALARHRFAVSIDY